MRRAVRELERRQHVGEFSTVVVVEKVVLVGGRVDVRRDVKIGMSVVVDVATARRRRLVAAGKAPRAGDLGEDSSAVVAVEKVAAVSGNEQIQIAVAIDIGDARAVAA